MYYIVEWEVMKKDFIRNYVRGYEVFTTIKKRDEYIKIMESDTIKKYIVNAEELNDLIKECDTTLRTNYGVVHVLEIQFH